MLKNFSLQILNKFRGAYICIFYFVLTVYMFESECS